MGMVITILFDHIDQTKPLAVIALSSVHCNWKRESTGQIAADSKSIIKQFNTYHNNNPLFYFFKGRLQNGRI
jgi:uncharacterized membrane protein